MRQQHRCFVHHQEPLAWIRLAVFHTWLLIR
jgi:hypothetical protein